MCISVYSSMICVHVCRAVLLYIDLGDFISLLCSDGYLSFLPLLVTAKLLFILLSNYFSIILENLLEKRKVFSKEGVYSPYHCSRLMFTGQGERETD